MALIRTSRVRVELYDHDADHGPGTLRAIIDDAKNIGVSEYANDVGEFFMTLPISHPDIGQIQPLERHYRVLRWNSSDYEVVGVGVIDDYDATDNEVVVYGLDYKSLLETTISGSNQSYLSAAIGLVVESHLNSAINEADSRLGFTSLGTIEQTSITMPLLLTSFEPRLNFIRSIADISMSDRSVRTLLRIPREPPWAWDFIENYGEDRTRMRMEWGGSVSGFRYRPGFSEFATRIQAIGVKREGASILYSTQTGASEATFGRIARSAFYQDIVDQTALDRKTKREARRSGRADKYVQLIIKAGFRGPYITYEIGDSVPVVLSRGSLVDLDALYTIWGHEWTIDPTGQENLYLDLQTKDV